MAAPRARAPKISRRRIVPAPQPTLGYVDPCRAAEIGTPPHGERWVHEIKEDGFRTQLHRQWEHVTLYSSNGHDYTRRYRSIAAEALELLGGDFVVDGEMVVPRSDGTTDFRALATAVASHDSEPL